MTSRILALAWLISLLGGAWSWSAPDYAALAGEVRARLERAEKCYADHDVAAARALVQSAYFEVFENLEGPIRINLSAKKSYELEAAFGEIRRMMGGGALGGEINQKIAWLNSEVAAALPVLLGGHQLVAEAHREGVADLAPAWREGARRMAEEFAAAVEAYQNGGFKEARRLVEKNWFDNFKNSEMEISVRLHRSRAAAADVNQRFSRLVKMAADRQTGITALGYEITRLQEDLAELLPGLPPSRADAQAAADARLAADSQLSADWPGVAQKINAAFDAAIAQYENGDAKNAALAVQDAYFDLFEASGMENKIGARDVAFKTQLESYFTRTVSLMKAGRSAAELRGQAAGLAADLARAAERLGGARGRAGAAGMFVYSLTIILREGLEALLIVAAIAAYLVRSGHADKLKLVRNSVWWALLASVMTAVLFQWLFINSGANREILEGVTMLAAVVVLFGMSCWLLSKVEARRWKAYLDAKLTLSLTTGSLAGLWLASFLAVYREGAETVLFYSALAGDARGGADFAALAAGFGAGAALLAVIYLVMKLTVTRLPLKPFFLVTGAFMLVMSFSFAGKGMRELIEGKVFQPTLVPRAPEFDLLGIYPYVETLAPQLILFAAAVLAWWLTRRNPKAADNEIPTKESNSTT
ncbi:MAG: FTR1 family iron permease [Verrucomicrobiales bacterium]|jgi:high-affinity iron transporter|nr:FTR1 family iron permease [Verrucomicrobiales bacterium]